MSRSSASAALAKTSRVTEPRPGLTRQPTPLAMEGTKRSSRLARVIETPLWMKAAMSSGSSIVARMATMLSKPGRAANWASW